MIKRIFSRTWKTLIPHGLPEPPGEKWFHKRIKIRKGAASFQKQRTIETKVSNYWLLLVLLLC